MVFRHCPLTLILVFLFQDVRSVLLFSALVAGANRVVINGPFSRLIERMNSRQRNFGITKRHIPEVNLGPIVKYSDAEFVGMDSLLRTGDCWQEAKEDGITFDLHYGYHLLTIVLPSLKFEGKNMSGFVRVRENSVHVSYTLLNKSEKCLTLDEMKIEKMGNVEFATSRPDYDGTNLDPIFQHVVIPTLNGIVTNNFKKIENVLQPICKLIVIEKKNEDLLMLLL